MATVSAEDLRNDTPGVLRRAQAGEEVVITVMGRPVARLGPLPATERRPMPRAELARRLRTAQADPGLRDELGRLVGDTTDDLEPLL